MKISIPFLTLVMAFAVAINSSTCFAQSYSSSDSRSIAERINGVVAGHDQLSTVMVVNDTTGEIAIGVGSPDEVEAFQNANAVVTPSSEGRLHFGAKAQSEAEKLPRLQAVAGLGYGLVWYYSTVAASFGIQLSDFLQAGVEGGMLLAARSVGGHWDVYAKLTPVPIGAGKHIYVGILVGEATLRDSIRDFDRDHERYVQSFVGWRSRDPRINDGKRTYYAELGQMLSGPRGDRESDLTFKIGMTVPFARRK